MLTEKSRVISFLLKYGNFVRYFSFFFQNVEDDMDGIERPLGPLDESGNRLMQENIPGSEEVRI